MSVYWIAPSQMTEPIFFGAARIRCSETDFLSFQKKVQSISNSRFLLSFKSSLILSDDLDFCGESDEFVDLSRAGDVIFDGHPYQLSHCAEAFFDRVPGSKEWHALFEQMEANNTVWTAVEKQWLNQIKTWLSQSSTVVVLKEDV
jgi:hypothetical protein